MIEMQEFNIKDMVRLSTGDEGVIYMIVDVFDFSDDEQVEELDSDYDYELAQIYPTTSLTRYIQSTQSELTIVEEFGTKTYNMLWGLVLKEREEKGYYDAPSYLNVAEANLNFHKKNKTYYNKIKLKEMDIVRYDRINTIDECLDALNDLTGLYEMFGDEAFLQLREVVMKRIKELQIGVE